VPQQNEQRSVSVDVIIGVTGVSLQARVGVTDPERAVERTLLVDVELVPRGVEGLTTDDLAGTVDYGRVVRLVTEIVTGDEHRLIEHIAALICERLLAELDASQVSVTVRKPAPPTATPVLEAWTRVTRRA
jgi:7,8-dihydroneopterin aldolase/epimerase/oxygenase